jgi:hypothetical protein
MLKNKPLVTWELLTVALMVSFSGCAAGYHDYSGCCIPYLYCSPPPLPYAAYEGCRCPTPVASQYLEHETGFSSTVARDANVPIVVPAPLNEEEPASPTPQR